MANIPENLNQDFITEIWRRYLNDPNLTTKDFKISIVGDVGDHYASIMTRAVCKVESNGEATEKSMVIKSLPTGVGILQFVQENRLFEKEITMLSKIIPALEKILKNVGIDSKLAANVYHVTGTSIIAMEDLANDGFAVCDRHKGLPLENCLTVARKLAEFHAATMVYIKDKPNLYDDFRYGTFSKTQAEKMGSTLTHGLETIIKSIDSWSPVKWSDKLSKLLNKIPDKLFEATDYVNPNRPIVLNHGDLWLNNIMFTPSTDLRFVDLQLSWIQSPVFDLHYFLFSTPAPDVRITHLKTILKTYHDRFTEVIKALKLEITYSFEDMLQDFHDNLFYGFTIFFYLFPITTAPKADAIDTDSTSEDIMKDNPIFQHEYFKTSFLAALPFFEECGLFKN